MNKNLVDKVTANIADSLNKIAEINSGNTIGSYEQIKDDDYSALHNNMKLWEECFQLQSSFNAAVDANWIKSNYNWGRAIRAELVEGIESFPWKWWKKNGKPDLLNASVELVDVFHFLLSLTMMEQYKNDLSTKAGSHNEINGSIKTATFMICYSQEQNYTNHPFDQEAFLAGCEDIIKFTLIGSNSIIIFQKFMELWLSLGYKLIDLLKLYRAKNILNQFRQDNGYKDKTYHKIWGEEEDNVVCWNIANKLPFNDTIQFRDDLTKELTSIYNELFMS
jgi:dimeric dUTPase (all-alpha-NTP-PPase superfamily)